MQAARYFYINCTFPLLHCLRKLNNSTSYTVIGKSHKAISFWWNISIILFSVTFLRVGLNEVSEIREKKSKVNNFNSSSGPKVNNFLFNIIVDTIISWSAGRGAAFWRDKGVSCIWRFPWDGHVSRRLAYGSHLTTAAFLLNVYSEENRAEKAEWI